MEWHLSVASLCSLWKHKQLTHLISGASEINKFIFIGLLRHFFQGWMDAHFLGAPFQDDFFPTTVLRFGCVLEETHGITYLKVVREVLKEGKELKVNVIELYVIKSWWKIKFNKRKVYHQLVCLFVFVLFCFFLLIKSALNNLDKLDDVVTELLLRRK